MYDVIIMGRGGRLLHSQGIIEKTEKDRCFGGLQ